MVIMGIHLKYITPRGRATREFPCTTRNLPAHLESLHDGNIAGKPIVRFCCEQFIRLAVIRRYIKISMNVGFPENLNSKAPIGIQSYIALRLFRSVRQRRSHVSRTRSIQYSWTAQILPMDTTRSEINCRMTRSNRNIWASNPSERIIVDVLENQNRAATEGLVIKTQLIKNSRWVFSLKSNERRRLVTFSRSLGFLEQRQTRVRCTIYIDGFEFRVDRFCFSTFFWVVRYSGAIGGSNTRISVNKSSDTPLIAVIGGLV